MSYRVLLGIPDSALAGEAAALTEEGTELTVVATAADAGAVTTALSDVDVDAVILHEDLGPLPVMDLARELSASFPHAGIVLVVREQTPEVLRSALQSGVRDVVSLPLSLEELQEGVRGAASWSRAVRQTMSEDGVEPTQGVGGTMIVVAGAKGGVGASTLAVHLALEAARGSRERSVCLADFDLQAGDLRVLLDLPYRRSVTDLLGVVDEMSPRQLEETLYAHKSGMRVLLAPDEGEQGEEVRAGAARQILGALKSQHDVVIVDVGTTMTEANTVAVEIADRVVVVATPDVPSLRAANRLAALWKRLGVRDSEVTAVITRSHKDSEVQPDLARKVLDMPLAEAAVPAGFRELEPAVNTGSPERVAEGPVRAGVTALARELGAVASQDGKPEGKRRLRLRGESGQVAVETTGLALLLMLLALLVWQMVLTGYTYVLAGHSAREGARELAVKGEVERVSREDLPKAWRDGMKLKKGEDFVEVNLAVPVVLPGADSPLRIPSRAGTVVEGEPLPEDEEKKKKEKEKEDKGDSS